MCKSQLSLRQEAYDFIELTGDNFDEVCSFLGARLDVVRGDEYIEAIKGMSVGTYTKLICPHIFGGEALSIGDYIFRTLVGQYYIVKKDLFNDIFLIS